MNSIASRISRLEARIRDSVCPNTIAFLVGAMTSELDPEAIAPLIDLLDHGHDYRESVRRALARYGEAAEECLRAYVASEASAKRNRAEANALLERMALAARYRELGCF